MNERTKDRVNTLVRARAGEGWRRPNDNGTGQVIYVFSLDVGKLNR